MHEITYYRRWLRTDEDVYDKELHSYSITVSVEPDEVDQEEGKTAVDLAVEYLADTLYVQEPSSYPHWTRGMWYSRNDEPDQLAPDEATHEETTAHLKGFTDAEERAVFDGLKTRGALIV